jgi:hypothetical protein
MTNPYVLTANTTLSIPAAMGTIAPNAITLASGVTIHDFYFYPSATFNSGILPLTLISSIGSNNCSQGIRITLPELCPSIDKCDFKWILVNVTCHQMSNGQYGYTYTCTIDNPYGAMATMALTASNGQGYCLPSPLILTPGIATYSVDFYPMNGFHGGSVTILGEGHYRDAICAYTFKVFFPELCCPNCRVEGSTTNEKVANTLIVAPNPTHGSTTIWYAFAYNQGTKTIVATDLLGRVLQEWQINDSKGTIEYDCARLAQGSYLVLMKQDETVIESTKISKH